MKECTVCCVTAKYNNKVEDKIGIMREVLTKYGRSDLTVFPELFLEINSSNEREVISEIKRMSKKTKTIISFGASFKQKKIYNSLFLITPEGRVNRYDKVHLTSLDKKDFSNGKLFKVVNTRIGKIGLAVCYDLLFPEAFRTLKLTGAEIIVLGSLWPGYDNEGWEIFTKARCRENQVFGVFSGGSGLFYDYARCGNSRIVDPFGKIIISNTMKNENYSVIKATLDPILLKRAMGIGCPKENYMKARQPKSYKV